jgi:hypothetical protein
LPIVAILILPIRFLTMASKPKKVKKRLAMIRPG